MGIEEYEGLRGEPAELQYGPRDLTYRPGEPAFAGRITQLSDRAQAKRRGLPASNLIDPQEEARLAGLLTHDDTWSEVAFDDDELVACVLAYPTRDTKGKSSSELAHLDLLMVHPDYQHRGIGREFLEWVTAEFRAQGFQKMELWTEVTNEHARHLYEVNGWQLVEGKVRRHPRSHELQVHYLLNLRPGGLIESQEN